MVAAISGLAPRSSVSSRFTMPAMAAAAFPRICRDSRLSPAMSTIGYSMAMSFVPTNGRVSPDASVETISFGKPAGSDRIAVVPMVVPAEPPREIRPWILPSSKSRRTR